MAEQDYIASVLAAASEEDRAAFGKSDPSLFRELQYGFEKSTFMGADAARLLEASTTDRTIQDIEAERLGRIESKFGDLSKESKDSYAALAGELVGEIIDPTLLALGPAGLAAKGTKIGKIGQRVYSSAYGAGLFGSDAAIDLAARGQDVTASGVAIGAIVGGAGGAFVKPLVKGVDDVSTGVRAVAAPAITESEERVVKEILAEVDDGNVNLIAALEDVPNMGAKVAAATATRQRYRDEYVKFKSKNPDALSKSDLDNLKLERDKAKLFTQSLPEQMRRNAEIISDSLIETTDRLAKNGMLNKNTIARAVTRPLIGAGIGYGAGVTNQLISEDDTISPFAFMTIGLLGGQLSKKIIKTDYSANVKEEGLRSLEELQKNIMKAQINLLASGTTAARLNSLGADVSAFGKTLLSQRGADLKGVATVSVEEAKDIAIQELNNTFSIRMMDLGALGDDAKALREAAWKYSENFVDEGDLAIQGFNKAQISTIKQISEASKAIVNTVSSEADNVGIKFTRLEDYALPQMHDAKKMADARDLAIEAYTNGFAKQRLADAKASMLLKNPKADVSTLKISKKDLVRARETATTYVDDNINLGYSGTKRNKTWQSEGAPDLSDYRLRLTPLAKHFEQDRKFTDFEARKAIQDFLVQDVSEIIPNYVNTSMPNIEFARAFGARGDAIFQLKRSIQDEAIEAKRAAGGNGELYKTAEKVKAEKIKNIHNAVDMYFGSYGSETSRVTSDWATSTLSVMTTLGNVSMLTKVTLDSVGDLVQPFVNSGFSSSMKGKARTNSKELTDFAESTGFAKRDVLSQELRALALDKSTAGSKTQDAMAVINDLFFRVIGLGKLTSYARRFAYNTGIENAFEVAQEVSSKGMTQTVFNKAKALGLTDDYIRTLQKFKNVDEAFDDVEGKKILNIAGVKASDRDALIPQIGNRLGFSQTKDPLIRSLGQFLSWAQAKTTQTNAIAQRIEDGDTALAVRTLGSLVVYDGLVTLKQYFNDPTGKYLDEDVDSYTEKLVTREQLGSSIMQSGVSPFYINKMVAIAARPYGSTPMSNLAPAISLVEDYLDLLSSTVKNVQQGDIEGLSLQYLRRIPFGKEVEDVLAATGNELKDRSSKEKEAPAGRLTTLGFNKGGEVLDVPNVPTEPDERIDKMTGLPYDQQAGTAFVDEEDPLRRLGFKGGGEVDPLSRLGFGIGSLVSKGFAKLTDDAADVSEEVFKKEMDDLSGAIDKGETPKMFEEPMGKVVEPKKSEDYLAALNISKDEVDVWKTQNKADDTALSNDPQKQMLARELADQSKPIEQRRSNFLNYLEGKDAEGNVVGSPIVKEWEVDSVEDLIKNMPSDRDVAMSVASKQDKNKFIIGVNDDLKTGDLLAFRLDIPAYRRHNIWTLTAHKPVKGLTWDSNKKGASEVLGYGKTGRLTNVVFSGGDPETNFKIASGAGAKTPLATMQGNWVNHDSFELAEEALRLVKDPKSGWVQIGYNPTNFANFYNRKTLEPITEAEDVIQIGGFLIAKNPKTVDFSPVFTTTKPMKFKDGKTIEAGTQIPFATGGKVLKALTRSKGV